MAARQLDAVGNVTPVQTLYHLRAGGKRRTTARHQRDGSIELFDRYKMLKGLVIACEKRRVETEQLEAIVNRLQQNLQAEGR